MAAVAALPHCPRSVLGCMQPPLCPAHPPWADVIRGQGASQGHSVVQWSSVGWGALLWVASHGRSPPLPPCCLLLPVGCGLGVHRAVPPDNRQQGMEGRREGSRCDAACNSGPQQCAMQPQPTAGSMLHPTVGSALQHSAHHTAMPCSRQCNMLCRTLDCHCLLLSVCLQQSGPANCSPSSGWCTHSSPSALWTDRQPDYGFYNIRIAEFTTGLFHNATIKKVKLKPNISLDSQLFL